MAKHAGGRPTKLNSTILVKAKEYLKQAEDDYEALGDKKLTIVWHVKLPTIEGLANHLEIHKDTIYEWEKLDSELGQQFSDLVTRVRNIQAERLINNGLAGNYNPMIARLLLSSKHGYVEKQEQDINHSGNVSFVNDVPRPKND